MNHYLIVYEYIIRNEDGTHTAGTANCLGRFTIAPPTIDHVSEFQDKVKAQIENCETVTVINLVPLTTSQTYEENYAKSHADVTKENVGPIESDADFDAVEKSED